MSFSIAPEMGLNSSCPKATSSHKDIFAQTATINRDVTGNKVRLYIRRWQEEDSRIKDGV